nr:hypothetical protein [Corynebacterium matruchotii]
MRPTLWVNLHPGRIFTITIFTPLIDIPQRGAAIGAAVFSLLAHAFGDFMAKIAAVKFGNRAHYAM